MSIVERGIQSAYKEIYEATKRYQEARDFKRSLTGQDEDPVTYCLKCEFDDKDYPHKDVYVIFADKDQKPFNLNESYLNQPSFDILGRGDLGTNQVISAV